MARWVLVATTPQLEAQNPLGRTVEGVSLVLVSHGGDVVALEDRCPHLGAPLREGCVEDGMLVCPAHRWRIDAFGLDARTPPEMRGRQYDVRVTADGIEVDLDS